MVACRAAVEIQVGCTAAERIAVGRTAVVAVARTGVVAVARTGVVEVGRTGVVEVGRIEADHIEVDRSGADQIGEAVGTGVVGGFGVEDFARGIPPRWMQLPVGLHWCPRETAHSPAECWKSLVVSTR
jgi:hypothetical protein